MTGYKTYAMATLAVVYALSGWFLGNMDANTAIQIIVPALGAAFVRHGISTTASQ